MNKFYCGLDLGQAHDFTALAVLECSTNGPDDSHFHCRHLKRFPLRTPYPEIVKQVELLMRSPALGVTPRLIVDATGVGRPVVDLFRAAKLRPVAITITGGNAANIGSGGYHVPKRDLVSVLQVLLQSGRLKFAKGLPDIQVLVNELLNFQVKISPAGHDSYEAWREGAHDDLVLALSLAAWFAERKARKVRAYQGYV